MLRLPIVQVFVKFRIVHKTQIQVSADFFAQLFELILDKRQMRKEKLIERSLKSDIFFINCNKKFKKLNFV